MKCRGCYKEGADGFCPRCRKKLFDGKNVSDILPFDAPQSDNLSFYQEHTKSLSISGVQLKYSLKLSGKVLELTDKDGQYILKPVPPVIQLRNAHLAPENEHLTMQIAEQIFGIRTAANALIHFKDGTPAYLTRRFDVRADGSRHLQEDMAQLSQRSRDNAGDHYKYDGSYEEIGRLIRQYVAAGIQSLDQFFILVLFNYLLSNGDAHLKNFSLLQTDMRDYRLSPAYDLMSTIMHVPNETDLALELYSGYLEEKHYSVFGSCGRSTFQTFGELIGLSATRVDAMLTRGLSLHGTIADMVKNSFLTDEAKSTYLLSVKDKYRRMGVD